MSAGSVTSQPPDVAGAVTHALRRLSYYVRRNRGYYLLCVATILGYNAGFVAVPILVGRVIAVGETGLGRDEIALRCMVLIGIVAFAALMRFLSRTLVFNAAREVEYEIRNDLFSHLQRLPQSFFFRWRTGDLMSRCVNDLNSVRMLLGVGLLNLVQTPLMFVAVLAAMFVINAKLALLVLAPYPAFLLIARAFGRALHTRNLDTQVALAELSNRVQEAMAGISVIKAYAMEPEQEKRFDRANQALYRRNLQLVRVTGAMPAITGMLPAVAMFVVLIVGGRMIGAGTLTVAEFFIFAMYIYQLTFPTFIMGWVVALVQRGAAAMQRIDEILSVEPSIADRPDVEPIEALRGEIEFRGFSFGYDGEGSGAVLKDIDLRVPAGTSLGIVGRVGSGKTTLASVIPRLFEVKENQLFLDGVDVTRIPLATLRSSVAMVPQESFLFSMSLADNVAYGLPDTQLELVREASVLAALHKDIAELPAGYDTLVGERGVMLSGGQRQRTALARALALRPSILILDDTFSSVDAETEASIQRGLAEVFARQTVVVVASRVSSVQVCDQIVVLDEGRIVERGTHSELLAAGGIYARLAQEQERERERFEEFGALNGVGELA